MFLCVLCLLNSDIPLTEMEGSDNIFVAVVLPDVFLQDSKCEVSLHHIYICLHHRKLKNGLEEQICKNLDQVFQVCPQMLVQHEAQRRLTPETFYI